MSRAFLFPGQGAQVIGMGRDLAAAYPAAAAVFAEVDDALGAPLSALIWDGDIAELTLTENAQPALMATSIAALRALESEGQGVGTAAFVAGHSLGEYSALCAAGALRLGDTARLLRLRGRAMQAAVPVGMGAMAAILGLDIAAVEAVAAEAAQGEVCEATNAASACTGSGSAGWKPKVVGQAGCCRCLRIAGLRPAAAAAIARPSGWTVAIAFGVPVSWWRRLGGGNRPGRHAAAGRGVMELPFGLGLWGAAFMVLAFFVAAFVRGYSGFGFSALVVASSSLVTNPLNFVAVVMIWNS